MVFRSRIDWWLVIIALAVPGWQIARQWSERGSALPPAFWITLGVLAFLIIALAPIRYVVEGRTVIVQCGLIRWEYAAFSVDDIQKIRPTHNPLGAPALSLDRLNIELTSGREILISPDDKSGFLRAIEALNPQLRLAGNSLVRAD